MKLMQHVPNRGITIVEVLVGVSIMGLVIIFVAYTITLFFDASHEALDRTQALYLAEEGQEIMRFVRDADWGTIEDDLSNGTTYYLEPATTTLATTSVQEVIDGKFYRSFTLSEVRRDNSTDDIVTSGGAVDDDSRFVTVSVAWDTATVTLTSLLTNIYNK